MILLTLILCFIAAFLLKPTHQLTYYSFKIFSTNNNNTKHIHQGKIIDISISASRPITIDCMVQLLFYFLFGVMDVN